MSPNDLAFFVQEYLDHNPYLLPVGLIGLWRWSVWAFKEIVALRYRPQTKPYKADVSLVIPVYNENPKIFRLALESWIKNKPKEIIAVIDYTDKKCIEIYKSFAKKSSLFKLIVTKVPGKRPALADGIKKARSEIVVLVDSDTIWDKDVIKNGLPPFNDKKVAGVATYQNVYNPKTVSQKMFDTQLDLRYSDDYPFLAVGGDALTCLSGRTAFYRRKIILPMLHDLVHETFNGEKVISGDDKRLTYLVLQAGWKTAYQNNSKVYTPGMADFRSYLKQRLRWSRNAVRADMRALFQGWPFKHKALAFFQIDKFLQAIVVAISPIYFIVSLMLGMWLSALFIVVWWIVSRMIKMYPHIRRRPQDIIIFPLFVLSTFFTGILKIYAFFTLNTQGWFTRWDASRLPRFRMAKILPGYAATAILLVGIGAIIYLVKQFTYIIPLTQQQHLVETNIPQVNKVQTDPELLNPVKDNPNLLTRRHVLKEGESFFSVAAEYGLTNDQLLAPNISRITNWNNVPPGTVLTIPGPDTQLNPVYRYNYRRMYGDPLVIYYDSFTNTIIVSGRGQQVTLADIAAQVSTDHLEEVKPKEWLLKVNLLIRPGIILTLDKKEVEWLKLASNKDHEVFIRANDAVLTFNNIKVTSWDERRNNYDKNLMDGRAFILVKDGSRLDIYNSELAYLGYPRTPTMSFSPYGVSWRMSNGKLGTTLLTGEVINSKFHNNYFGAYTFGATGMTWRGNEFYDNIRYGLDPHDDSNGFLVINNVAHHNGTHGIIFSKRCVYNTIRNNLTYSNGIHGIMLHEKSNFNIIENNRVLDNRASGIALWRTSYNLVRNNSVEGNRHAIRANHKSISNVFIKNDLSNNDLYGVYLYDNAHRNVISNNTMRNNLAAAYIKTDGNEIMYNDIAQNRVGIHFQDRARDNKVVNNYIAYNTYYGIYSKLLAPTKNIRGENTLWHNRSDIVVFMNKESAILPQINLEDNKKVSVLY